MKKKVFRERYNLVLDKNAEEIKIPALEYNDGKVKKKPTKRGKKNDKSNK